MLLFNIPSAAIRASLDHHERQTHNPRRTTMTKFIISTLAAAIALSSASSSFAAPKQQVQKVQQPTYFTLATGRQDSNRPATDPYPSPSSPHARPLRENHNDQAHHLDARR